jgi:hypothetical protein
MSGELDIVRPTKNRLLGADHAQTYTPQQEVVEDAKINGVLIPICGVNRPLHM